MLDMSFAAQIPPRPSTVAGNGRQSPRRMRPRRTRTGSSATPSRRFAASDVTVDALYATPTQHHNPIELFTTLCAWDGHQPDRLGILAKRLRHWHGLAEQLGIDAGKHPRDLALCRRRFRIEGLADAAHGLDRLCRPAPEASGQTGRRRARKGSPSRPIAPKPASASGSARRDGKLRRLLHEGWEATSRPDGYMVAGTDATRRIYALRDVATKVSIVHADRNTPGFMRSPPEVPICSRSKARWTNWLSR